MTDETHTVLNRIADALERIADAMEHSDASAAAHQELLAQGAIRSGLSRYFNGNGHSHDQDPCDTPVVLQNSGSGLEANMPEPAHETVDVSPIIDFLASRDIEVKTVPEEDAADEVINSLAEFLGDRYAALEGVLAKIKRNMQQGGFFSTSIRDYSQQEISDICQFCTRLHDIAFLEDYTYFKSPKYLIKAKTTTLPAAQNFFSGQWLERYVLLKSQHAVDTIQEEIGQELAFSYLLNPQVVLGNGDDFELDLMFQVEGMLFWIEAKSGHYQQHISKYARMSRNMGLDTQHAIIVLTDVSPDKTQALTALFGMTVCTLDELQGLLTNTIKYDLNIN